MKANTNFFNILKYQAVFFFACLLATPAMAQMEDDYRPFRDWDTDNNYQLTRDEFYTGVSTYKIFPTWDEDDNGSLNKNELRSGIYKKWERSGENFKTGAQARAHTWARYYTGTFDDWDLDGDGTVTNAEYRQKIGKEKKFQLEEKMDVNKDGRIEEREFWATVFSMWDDDNSGYLTDEEYDPDEFESWFL